MQVTKRDGLLDTFNIEKVKRVIGWAAEGLDVNALELESKVDIIFNDGIKTNDIQDNLITHAASLTSIEEPDWKYVAGRLVMMSIWKKLGKNPNKARDFVDYVYDMVVNKKYDDTLVAVYSEKELKEAGEYISPDRDLNFDYAGALKLKKSYLLDGESPQEAFMAISLLLASVEKPKHRLKHAKEFYDAISQQKVSPATPFLGNLRKPNGNLSSCFIISIDDSLNSITRAWEIVANISKNGGGVGINISKIRGKGSDIQGVHGASGGVIPLIRTLNDIAIYINQLGKRAGAFTIALDNWHIDLEAFLELQTENGDQRTKAYDIQPQLVVSDLFMERDRDNAMWTLFDPHEVKQVMGFDLAEAWGEDFREKYLACEAALEAGKLRLCKKISARQIMKMVVRNYIETGLPYIAFKDAINRVNPNKHEGYIPSVNLCVESYSNVIPDKEIHTCNLASINWANISDSKEEEEYYCRLAVRMLDNAIELTDAPAPESKYHNEKYRTIGVGSMGLADWIAKNGYTYDKSIDAIDELFERIALYCTRESVSLARERGPFKAFAGSMWDTGERIDVFKTQSNGMHKHWEHIQKDINAYGIRNSQITAIAPNTSTSLVQGCTASIWPTYSKFFFDNNSSGAIPITPKYIKDRLWSYKEYKHMDMKKMNSIVAKVQHWTDTGISYEPIFDLNKEDVDAYYMYSVIVDAWIKGLKTLYYVRSVQKDSSMRCESCAG